MKLRKTQRLFILIRRLPYLSRSRQGRSFYAGAVHAMSFIIGDVPPYTSTGAPMQNHPGSRKGKDIMKEKPGKKPSGYCRINCLHCYPHRWLQDQRVKQNIMPDAILPGPFIRRAGIHSHIAYTAVLAIAQMRLPGIS
jgi:hypothetical protein